MHKSQRFSIICDELKSNDYVSLEQLTSMIDVSYSTLRRDIEELEQQNMLKRVHGGIVPIVSKPSYEPPFNVRQDICLDEKMRIAMAAHKYVKANESLLLGSGTTINCFSQTLSTPSPLYVATNDLMSATTLAQLPDVNLIMLGGQLRHNHFSINGYFTNNMIGQIHADTAFIGVDAIDLNIGFMNFSSEELQTNKSFIQAAQKKIVLCDHTKFEKIAFVNICPFSDIDVLITGKEACPEYIERIREHGVEVVIV